MWYWTMSSNAHEKLVSIVAPVKLIYMISNIYICFNISGIRCYLCISVCGNSYHALCISLSTFSFGLYFGMIHQRNITTYQASISITCVHPSSHLFSKVGANITHRWFSKMTALLYTSVLDTSCWQNVRFDDSPRLVLKYYCHWWSFWL